MEIHKEPLSRKEWKFWEDRLGFFIQEFDDNIAAPAREVIEENLGKTHDHYIAGMVQGMWAVYSFIEARMVEKEKVRGRKKGSKLIKKRRKEIKIPTGYIVGKRERKIILPSSDVLKVLEGDGTELSSKEIWKKIVAMGDIKPTKKNRKKLADRLFMLNRDKKIKSNKVDKKRYYRL